VHSHFYPDCGEECELSSEQLCLKRKMKLTSHKQSSLLFMVIVSRLTAQADIVRAAEKVTHSLQPSKRAVDQATPLSNVAGVCFPDKELSYSCVYELRSRIGKQVG
jgi:hypothetical protein